MVKGLSKLVLPNATLAEFFTQAEAAGYDAVELALEKEGELTLSSPREKIDEILKLTKKHGLPIVSVVQLQCTGNLLADGEEQDRSVAETVAGLEITAALGAKCVLHTLGRVTREICYDKAYENAAASLKRVAPEAARLGVNFAVEFVWNGFLFSPLEMKRLLDEVGSKSVGFYFDPGNMAVFQYPEHWARILGGHIMMVHMKDWRGNALDGGWPALLKGEVDFSAVMAELRRVGYNGPLISEVETGEASIEETAMTITKIMIEA